MNEGTSRKIWEEYFKDSDRLVEVTLNDGRKLSGVFVSFIPDNFNTVKTGYLGWHLVKESQRWTVGIDPFGFLVGEIINEANIVSVKSLSDNTIIHFVR